MRFFIFILITQITYSQQNFLFYLYGKRDCEENVTQIKAFELTKDNTSFKVEDSTGAIVLNSSGIYQLKYVIEDIDTIQQNKKYYIGKEPIYRDTLKIYSMFKCLNPTSRPSFSGYCCCDQKCNGNQIDYYSNGKKMVEGYFENGQPIGLLKIYYRDGSTKEIKKYNRKGKFLRVKNYKMGECFE